MTLEDLLRLAAGLIDSVSVCRLSDSICTELDLASPVVKLATADLKHILSDHKDVDVTQLCMLPKALQLGLIVEDLQRPGHLICCYQDPYVEARRYKAVIRIRAKHPWVLTFHRTAKKQTRTILNRGRKLKDHDRQ